MQPVKFSRIAESLRQYRRAELKEFEIDAGVNPVDTLYVDPLPDNAVLQTVLSSNTTFLLGRKGTGKSTVFAKAQSEIRKRNDLISVYIDVKSLYELITTSEAPVSDIPTEQISSEIYQSHMLRKSFLGVVLSELIKEVNKACESLSLWDRWMGKKWDYDQLLKKFSIIGDDVRTAKLRDEEIPILRRISEKTKDRRSREEGSTTSLKADVKASLISASSSLEGQMQDIDKTLSDNEIYSEYSDVILRSFPFGAILEKIKNLLEEAGMKRLVVFFDDFSEIGLINQRLFVDIILAPLNNASDERVKLKIAGYPGRIYYGKIDPSKVDTISLDFFSIYKSQDIQTAETAATDYTTRLLEKRFNTFGENLSSYFDASIPMTDYMRLMFEVTFNVPRLMGHILHHCYLDRVSKKLPITQESIRLASQKYYENVVALYFDRMNRFALEPFERKLDRHNQYQLLKELIKEVRIVRRRIMTGEVGGTFFSGILNPPVSHFAVSPKLEKVLSSLELNFMLTKYYEMRDKDGSDILIYAFFYGLCESERFPWGRPRRRGSEDRKYFQQRCFNYNHVIYQFLAKSQTIRCGLCEACFSMNQRESFELFKWKCPDCNEGSCSIVVLGEEFKTEVENLNKEIMLESVEIEILEVLNDEKSKMRASEISSLIDVTYQLVGKRTSKLQQMGLVDKNEKDGTVKSSITDKAKSVYFDNA